MREREVTDSAATSAKPSFRGSFLFVGVLMILGVGCLAFAAWRIIRPADAKPESNLAQEAEADLAKRGFQALSSPLQELLQDANYKTVATETHNLLYEEAPKFALSDTEGQEWSLSSALSKGPVVLVFYYGYHCNHCVSQLFGLNKDLEKFRELGVQVVAISPDSAELTKKRYKKYGAFAFPVLSDPGNKVAQEYLVYQPSKVAGQEGTLLHGTFVINRKGKIIWANRGEEPFTQNQTLLIECWQSNK
jgi:peroxiredoxin